MKLRLAATMVCLVIAGIQSSVNGQDLDELTKRVEVYSRDYAEAFKNVHCDVEGRIAGTEFHGSFAVLNGVRAFSFPANGAFRFSRIEKNEKWIREVVKIGNPQYSFRLEKRQPEKVFGLKELNIQFENQNRKALNKDPIFFSFSANESWALYGPIMVFDMTSVALLHGDHGVKRRIVDTTNPNETVVEFDFPPDHPFWHKWAKVSFGASGEVLSYKLKSGTDARSVTYSHSVRYSDSDRWGSAIKLPCEFRETEDTTGSWFKLSNFQFGKNEMAEFTLSHYGIPEPDGSSVLGRHQPIWLLGTVAGAFFLAIGIYLRRRANRSE